MKIFATILLSTLVLPSLARANGLPSNYNQCGQQVQEPNTSNGYLWSDDCKTVYVLPPDTLKIRVAIAPDPDTEPLCHKLLHEFRALNKKMLHVSKYVATNPARFDAEMKRIRSVITTWQEYGNKQPAAILSSQFTIAADDAYLTKFRIMNSNLVKQGVSFAAMPLSQSYYSFDPTNFLYVFVRNATPIQRFTYKFIGNEIQLEAALSANWYCASLEYNSDIAASLTGTATFTYETKEGPRVGTSVLMP